MRKLKSFSQNLLFAQDIDQEERWRLSRPYREWFGKQLERAIKDRGFSFTKFADELGITLTQLIKYRKGLNWPDLFQLSRIAKLLRKPLNHFIHPELRTEAENRFVDLFLNAYREGSNQAERR